jgi:hypothetical protein
MKSLFVISRNSTFGYKNSTKSARQIGEELGVRYLVTGSIRRHKDQIRVVANLLEVETGLNIWSERYDRKLGEVFAVQDDITRSLAVALELSIRNAEIKRAQKKPTDSLEAYDLYLRALQHVHATTEKDNALALSLLRTAPQIDTRFARTAAMAAMRFEYRSVQRWGGPHKREELAEAISLAESAVQLEPEDPVVLWAAAIIAGRFGQDRKRAADFIERRLGLIQTRGGPCIRWLGQRVGNSRLPQSSSGRRFDSVQLIQADFVAPWASRRRISLPGGTEKQLRGVSARSQSTVTSRRPVASLPRAKLISAVHAWRVTLWRSSSALIRASRSHVSRPPEILIATRSF